MISSRTIISSLFSLIAVCGINSASAFPKPGGGLMGHQQRTGSEQSNAPLAVTLNKGALQVQTPAGAAYSGLRMHLRFSNGSSLTGDFESAGQEKGTDQAGPYERHLFNLKASSSQ